MANQPQTINEAALRNLIRTHLKEALDNESISWPSTYWTEDDVDDYRNMNQDMQNSVDVDQKKFNEFGNMTDRVNVQSSPEEIEVQKNAFIESVVNRTIRIMRENLNRSANPTAMSRLV